MTDVRSNWTGIAFGLTLACYAAFQQFKMPPAMPLMLETYQYDSRLAGGFMSIYALAGLLLSIPLGRLVARHGSGLPALVALLLMTLGTIATLLAPQSGLLVLAARLLEGTGFCILAIVGPVLANANASPRHLPFVVAGTAAWIPVGQLVAALSAGPLFRLMGWSALWWLALAMTAALGLWLLAIFWQRSVALGGTAGRTDADREEEAPDEGLSRAQRWSMAIAAAVFMLWSAQYIAYMTWLPEYLVSALGLSVDGALIGYAVPVGTLLLAIVLTGQLLSRGVSVGGLLVAGLLAQTLTWVALPFVGDGGLGAVTLIVYGAGGGIVPTCLFAMPATIAGRGPRSARAFGIMMTGRNTGVLIGPVVLAQTVAVAGGWDWAAPLLGTLTALALALGVWLAARVRAPQAA